MTANTRRYCPGCRCQWNILFSVCFCHLILILFIVIIGFWTGDCSIKTLLPGMCHFSQNLNEGTWRRFSSTRQPQYGFSMHSTLWTPSDIVDSMNERFGLMLRQDLMTLMNEGKAKSTCFRNHCKSTGSVTLSLDSSEGSGGGFVQQALSDTLAIRWY